MVLAKSRATAEQAGADVGPRLRPGPATLCPAWSGCAGRRVALPVPYGLRRAARFGRCGPGLRLYPEAS